jgi:glycosyltransferase involved in cell wall biosynthesis
MRILMLTPMPPSPQAPGAMPLVFHAALVGLSAHHDVSVVTVAGPHPGELTAIDELKRAGYDVHPVRRAQPRGISRWRRRWRLGSRWMLGREPWRTIWFWEPELQRTFDRLVAARRFDVIAAEDNAMGIYRYPRDIPTVLTEHEVRQGDAPEWRLRRPFRELDWRRWPSYHRSAWRRFDRLQVFTDRDADAVRALAPELAARLVVNPFGVELPSPLDHALEQPRTVLFAGNFTHPPNSDAALWLGREIMPRLREHLESVSLAIVGPWPPREVQALASEDIRVLGAVGDIRPWLERTAVVVAPVRIGGGMRMKVLHSMAAGKPVVTTPRGADGLAVNGQSAPVAIAEDGETFAKAVAGLLKDDGARRQLGASARAFVAEHFSPQAYARRLEAVYEDARQARAA